MDNQLIFPLSPSLTGIAAELSVVLVGDTGDVVGSALTVAESATVPGLYRATMAGAAGTYGALLLRAGAFVASSPVFRWSGTEFEAGLVESDRLLITATEAHARKMASQLGLVEGVTATHSPDAIAVSNGDGSTAISDNGDGSYTVAGV